MAAPRNQTQVEGATEDEGDEGLLDDAVAAAAAELVELEELDREVAAQRPASRTAEQNPRRKLLHAEQVRELEAARSTGNLR